MITNPLKLILATALLKALGYWPKHLTFFCFSLPKIYLKFTLLEICRQFSRLSFTDLCNSLRKFTQFSVSKESLFSCVTAVETTITNEIIL